MTDINSPPPDPGNSPPEAWTGDPIEPAEEQRLLADALAHDVRGEPYEVPGWEEEHGRSVTEVDDDGL